MKQPPEVVLVTKDIVRSRRFRRGCLYVIAAEVHVHSRVTLTIEDGVTLLIRNGARRGGALRRCALIFDRGSRLRAGRLTIRGASELNRPEKLADNGGVWFLGNQRAASKDGVSVRPDRSAPLSSFSARSISVHWLGRRDNPVNPRTGPVSKAGDDVDGFSVLGVGPEEWDIASVSSTRSADDGFDVTNSHIRLDRLEVRSPEEDGLNISSSRIEIRKRLLIDMGDIPHRDRELFDLEVDDGASYVEIHRGCRVQIEGAFGDQVVLSSSDLRQPARAKTAIYRFNGRSGRRASLVYSIDED